MKFTFVGDSVEPDDDFGYKTTVEVDCETWGQALEVFQHFLTGCGFLIDGTKINFKDICQEKHDETFNL